jgi:hypothetical protein
MSGHRGHRTASFDPEPSASRRDARIRQTVGTPGPSQILTGRFQNSADAGGSKWPSRHLIEQHGVYSRWVCRSQRARAS